MDLNSKRILITGGSGLAGLHLLSELADRGARKVFCPRSKEYDLKRPDAVEAMFTEFKPDLVFALAAKVGGILDNKECPADFYYENILIGAHTYDACARHNVEKLVNLGAGCGYPLKAPEPLREADFWDGFPQAESAAYSLAKKMQVIQGIAYRQQHGLSSITLIPSNLYGEYDNFNLETAHVVPALIRKVYEAVTTRQNQFEVWGDGSAKRDFIHSIDVVRAMIDAVLHYDNDMPLNIAYGKQTSIRELVELLIVISGFQGEVFWNTDRPSGQDSRDMSLKRLKQYVPQFSPKIDLREGLKRSYSWFAENYELGSVRL